ncbi:hypothetical protein ACI7RC_27370, partial [Brevibacillus sp. B_LB10_24]|uniref:hypothetical protein n=1 Tax=Brevibacillus sp. B_LB10_24 TaxID=3380645 RepID=UPI0038B7A0F6
VNGESAAHHRFLVVDFCSFDEASRIKGFSCFIVLFLGDVDCYVDYGLHCSKLEDDADTIIPKNVCL